MKIELSFQKELKVITPKVNFLCYFFLLNVKVCMHERRFHFLERIFEFFVSQPKFFLFVTIIKICMAGHYCSDTQVARRNIRKFEKVRKKNCLVGNILQEYS
jgi:hypothetical protein